MAPRPRDKQKQLESRTSGVMKKTYELHKLYGVQAASIVIDGDEVSMFTSKQGWPLVDLPGAKINTFLPLHFKYLEAGKTAMSRESAEGELPISQSSSKLNGSFMQSPEEGRESTPKPLVVDSLYSKSMDGTCQLISTDPLISSNLATSQPFSPQPAQSPFSQPSPPPQNTQVAAKGRSLLNEPTRSTSLAAPVTRSAARSKSARAVKLNMRRSKPEGNDDPYNFGA